MLSILILFHLELRQYTLAIVDFVIDMHD